MSYNGRHTILNVTPPPGPADRPVYAESWPPSPGGYAQPEPWPQEPSKPRRKRVFLWAFVAVQAVFILWLVVGLATVHTGPSAGDLAAGCYNGHWYPLFQSQADCVTHYGHALQEAGNVGKGLGAAIIVGLWLAADFLMGVSYLVYRLAKRPGRAVM